MTVGVIGENLVDLFVEPSGVVRATPGGGPFNVARTSARLGVTTVLFSGLSHDAFGREMATTLDDEGVIVAVSEAVDLPTAQAVVVLDAATPRYEFQLEATSAFALDAAAARRVWRTWAPALTVLTVGSLGLVVEPMATLVEHLVSEVGDDAIVILDPNCRPGVVADGAAYLDRIDRVAHRVDVVKLSTEDLAFLVPTHRGIDAARRIIERGVATVIVTDGPHPVMIVTGDDVRRVEVAPVEVLDTVGAGDALVGGLVAWWSEHATKRRDLADIELITRAVRAAVVVAASTCRRRGAQPPWRRDLVASSEWAPPRFGQPR